METVKNRYFVHFILHMELRGAFGSSFSIRRDTTVSAFIVVLQIEYGQTTNIAVSFDLVFVGIGNW